MSLARFLSSALLAGCLVLTNTTDGFAGGAQASTANARKQARKAASLSVPTGIARRETADASYGDAKIGRIKEFRNAAGQTVFSVAASHFDVSPPLREMAAIAGPDRAIGAELEAPANPRPPVKHTMRPDVPDPVVQSVIPPADSLSSGTFPLAAPTTGFNFLGVGMVSATPPDPNGSVGNDQFVETVNFRYQVWSLNRSTKVATPAITPTNINTLWTGFGGACEVHNNGDPIVVFDKVANRWMISQLTAVASGGLFYECVAVSTTADATGSYSRYAFAVPDGKLGDYPHYGVWADAYYMTGNAFTYPPGTFVAAMFAALDRTKMLAGDPAATWQVILDPDEGGHMAADLDGFAPPPTGAPGVFVSIHSPDMYIYRMKVDFGTPVNTVRTLQAIVPVAPSTPACGDGGFCIPQPGSTVRLSSFGGPPMFRAAYRNFIDHESLVVSQSVDPGVAGVSSGVRWSDVRLSGTPDSTCASYPCIYQQGTIADVPGGRNRWMPSIAMDGAENILVGYSTSGKTAGSENHSIRYTGRAKGDPAGVMTAPETTIVNGTANYIGSGGFGRWGDYTSMSIDPFDDCTFWYVDEYYTSTTTWSTRVASASFPAGSGPGECPPTACTVRPGTAPAIGAATVPGDNQIAVTWTGIVPAPGSYAIERADGACGSEGLYRPLAATVGGVTTFTDTTVLGGFAYSYRVIAATDAAGKCQAVVASGCVGATATGTCNLKPSFPGATSASSSQSNNCGVTIGWTPAASSCPLTPNLRYNIFRGTTPDFVPSGANRIATCIAGPSSYLDTDNLASGTTYYYVVRAEDNSTGNGGECGGNEDVNSVATRGTPYRAGTQSAPGTWMDSGGDGTSFLQLNVAGPGDTANKVWRFVKTADDAGANHTAGGAYAYRNAGPAAGSTYLPNVCAETQTPSLTAAAGTVNLQYWERHRLEYARDAIAVEYAVNGGDWTDVPAPSNDTGAGCAASDDTTGWETLQCAGFPNFGACDYPPDKSAFTGPFAGGNDCSDFTTSAITAYAHRCHQITGLSPDDTVQFRWRFSSDAAAGYTGFYLDDVAVTNIRLPNACTPDTCAAQLDGTACDDGDACTGPDSCASGACAGTAIGAPPEAQNLRVQADKTTFVWDPMPNSPHYDVIRGALGSLPVGPGGGDEVCFDDLVAAVFVDATIPAPGAGFWYVSRGVSVCGIGTYGTQSNSTLRTSTTCP